MCELGAQDQVCAGGTLAGRLRSYKLSSVCALILCGATGGVLEALLGAASTAGTPSRYIAAVVLQPNRIWHVVRAGKRSAQAACQTSFPSCRSGQRQHHPVHSLGCSEQCKCRRQPPRSRWCQMKAWSSRTRSLSLRAFGAPCRGAAAKPEDSLPGQPWSRRFQRLPCAWRSTETPDPGRSRSAGEKRPSVVRKPTGTFATPKAKSIQRSAAGAKASAKSGEVASHASIQISRSLAASTSMYTSGNLHRLAPQGDTAKPLGR